ncbi:hypothetical protein GGF31_005351 [Allomyces arbusculus]|nr:hypothetical protein GGF31_005351 [Allomyces arbusculus]
MASVNPRVLQPSAPVVTNGPVGAPPMISAPQLATKDPLNWASDDSLATLIRGTASVLPVTTETGAPCTYDDTATDAREVAGTAYTALTAVETLPLPLPAPDVFGPAIFLGAEYSVPSLESPVAPPHGTLHEPHAVVPNVCATAATAPIMTQVMNLAHKAPVVSHAAPIVLAHAHAMIAKIQTELEAPPPSAPVIDAALIARLIPQRKYTVMRKLKTTLTLTPEQLKKREQNRVNQQRARERKLLKLADMKSKVVRLHLEMAQADIDLDRLERLKSQVKMVRGELDRLVALLFAP